VLSWDARKVLRNFKKHGVSFEEATTVFEGAAALEFEDYEHAESEPRWVRIGFSCMGRILFVVYAVRRLKHEQETLRIISARQATRKEREAYAG
jgi:uncharacterized protein